MSQPQNRNSDKLNTDVFNSDDFPAYKSVSEKTEDSNVNNSKGPKMQ